MKIKKVIVHNINSFKGRHEVDFDQSGIAAAGLFAITGVTGSGKTTLLDAITLALYNRIPRIESAITKKTIMEKGIVITKGEQEALAEVEFETNGQQYRSTWSIATSNRGNLQDYHMQVATLPDGQPIDCKKSEVPDKNAGLIGLKYEQFIKSIMLSQGDFAVFLKAKRDDRSNLLEKITGLTNFRNISIAAFEKNRELNDAILRKQDEIGNIVLLTTEEKESLRTDINQHETNLKDYNDKQGIFQEKIKTKRDIEETQKSLKTHQEELKIQQKQLDELQPMKKKLDLHKKLTPLQPQLATLDSLKANQDETSSQRDHTSKEIENTTSALAQLQELLTRDNEVLKQKVEDHGRLREKCRIVDQLDAQMTTLSSDLAKLTPIQGERDEAANALDRQIKNLQNQLASIKASQDEAKNWIAQHQNFESIIPKRSLIENHLQQLEAKLVEINSRIEQNEKLKAELSGQTQDEKHHFIKKIRAEYEPELIKTKAQLEDDSKNALWYQELESHLTQWHHFSQQSTTITSEIETITDRRQNTQKKLDECQAQLMGAEKELFGLQTQLETSQNILQKMEKEAGLEAMRADLKDNEPCPLCGSLHHPYAHQAPQHLFDTVKKEITSQKNALKDKEAEIRNLQKQEVTLQKDLAYLIQELEAKSLQLTGLKESTNGLIEKITNEFAEYTPPKTDSAALTSHLEKVSTQKKLHARYQKINEGLQLINGLVVSIEEYEKIVQWLNSTFAPLTELDQHLSPAARYEYIEKVCDELVSSKEDMAKKDIEKASLEATLRETTMSYEATLRELAKLKSQSDTILQQKNEFSAQRISIFGAEDTSKTLEASQQLIDQLKERIGESQQKLASLKATLLSQETNHKNMTRKVEALQTRISAAEQKMIGLLPREIPTIEMLRTAIMTSEEVEQIEEQLVAANKKINETKGQIENEDQRLKSLLLKDDAGVQLESLEKTLKEINATLDEVTQLRARLIARLHQNEENEQKHKSRLSELEILKKNAALWQTLNELIGSARGDKFVRVAQDLVLYHLLEHANSRLKKLTDRYQFTRFKADIEDENDLYVTDSWQGNVRRSVHSLSGGESFILSLALALSLADMASSRTSIDCMFIDEGFGTLDDHTLDVVISTLETLQAQSGKMIGVISHVQQLKERLGARIEIRKGKNGYSKLEVLTHAGA